MDYPNYETLELERDGQVLHARLNRPDRRNAFNGAVVEDLKAFFTAVNGDDATRVVVLSGKGKSFSAGADLTWMIEQSELNEADNEQSAARMASMFLSIARCDKPVVARVHGHALGGGSGLTAAVDIAIGAETTVFGLTEAKLGIVPAVISPFVIQKIGAGRARVLFLTAERFDGREAERVGLLHRAVPEDQLDAEVARVVEELLSSGPAAVASAKVLIKEVSAMSLEDAIPLTAKWIAGLRSTPEAKEGMQAFLDKRDPGWMA